MVGHGNGQTARCVNNLMQITRGEIPYSRVKGIDARLYDTPAGDAEATLRAAADWVVRTYDPRARILDVSIRAANPSVGRFSVHVEIEEANR